MQINTTTGKFSVVIDGKVAAKHVEALVAEGLTSMLYRKAFPKTELAMAKAVGKTTLSKSGELQIRKDGADKFKRGEVPFSLALAEQLQGILAEFVLPYGDPDGQLFVTVGEYTAPEAKEPAQVTLNKAYNAAVAAVEGLRELIGDEAFNAQVAKLKVQYNQPHRGEVHSENVPF